MITGVIFNEFALHYGFERYRIKQNGLIQRSGKRTIKKDKTIKLLIDRIESGAWLFEVTGYVLLM